MLSAYFVIFTLQDQQASDQQARVISDAATSLVLGISVTHFETTGFLCPSIGLMSSIGLCVTRLPMSCVTLGCLCPVNSLMSNVGLCVARLIALLRVKKCAVSMVLVAIQR